MTTTPTAYGYALYAVAASASMNFTRPRGVTGEETFVTDLDSAN